MQIITGTARGIRLKSLPGIDTRPTSDRIKQALFNIIQFEIAGKTVLDLFAGTGQLGLEALSRGAKRAVFVDNSRISLSIMRENAEKTNLIEKTQLCHRDYKAFIKSAPKGEFQLIFVDPPYREGFIKKILNMIFTFDIVAVNGIIICESAAKEVLPLTIGDISLVKTYTYGTTALTIYRKNAPESEVI